MRTRADVVTVRLGLQKLGDQKQVPGRPNLPGRGNHPATPNPRRIQSDPQWACFDGIVLHPELCSAAG